MKQCTYLDFGSVHRLTGILQRINPGGILLVTGKSSYISSGAEEALSRILKHYRVSRFCDFETNPRIADVEKGVELFQEQDFDVLVSVGGGSVLDMSKLINVISAQDAAAGEIIQHQEHINRQGVPLIAIPTTAGSGSEATHFAVVYIDRTKYSVSHAFMLPDFALIDPYLTCSMTPMLTATTGMDAFSQAVESFWCVHSTKQSKAYAREAIRLILDHLHRAVHDPSHESRRAMCKASYLAGQAIDISKTTAPHALSYAMTSHFGVPHGQAVGVTLGEFVIFNSQVTDEDVVDARGAEYVRYTMKELYKLLGCVDRSFHHQGIPRIHQI